MLIGKGRILFDVVKEAVDEAGFSLQSKTLKTVLIWYDNLRETDFFSNLKPWQVVNRIPSINLICRKAPFIQLMNRMKIFFPTLYNFHPESLILPISNGIFQKLVSNNDKKYIVKPDGGSLGCGIIILSKNSSFKPFKNLSVAQEYIDSYLIDDTKFDLRVYALVASVSPLKIYVYHDGVARFCSEKSSANNIYSQLTNTAVNRNNPNAKIESITKTIKEVFDLLEKKGIDTKLLWAKIENAVILTILPVLFHIKQSVSQKCPPNGYNRCFQILGFDFIFDTDLNPYVLEVNYRPSLDADTEAERKLKTKMLGTAMHIGAPLKRLQKLINEYNSIASFSKEKWDAFFEKMNGADSLIDKNVNTGLFNLIYPSTNKKLMKIYDDVLSIVKRCPTKLSPRYKLPVPLKKPDPSLLPQIDPIDFSLINAEKDDIVKQTKKQQNCNNGKKLKANLPKNDQEKDLIKAKQQNTEKNAILDEKLKSKELTENINELIEEVNSIKEVASNEPKAIVPKNKQPEDQKLSMQKTQAFSPKSQAISCKSTEIKQKNIKKVPNEVIKAPNHVKLYDVTQSNQSDIHLDGTKIVKEKEINTSSNNELPSSKNQQNRIVRINKNRRSASTRPIRRSSHLTYTKINSKNNNNNHLAINDINKKYIDDLTEKLQKEINSSKLQKKNTPIKAIKPSLSTTAETGD